MSRQSLRTLATILGISFLICVGMQLFTLTMILLFHDWAYDIHARLFGISLEYFDACSYGLLALMKILGLTLFLTPWLAIKIATRNMAD